MKKQIAYLRGNTPFPFRAKWSGILVLIMMCAVAACVPYSAHIVTPVVTELSQRPTPSLPQPTPASDWASRWLRGTPCSPPCWEDITPGQTTVTETIALFQDNPLITRPVVMISELTPKLGYVFWDWFDNRPGGGAEFNALSSVRVIYAISPNFYRSVELQDVIAAYGEPTHIHAQAERNPDNTISYSLRILYRTRGILLSQGGNRKLDLTSNMTFDQITFFEPTDQALSMVLGGAAAHLEWLLPWQGIRDFDSYCRDTDGGRTCRENSN